LRGSVCFLRCRKPGYQLFQHGDTALPGLAKAAFMRLALRFISPAVLRLGSVDHRFHQGAFSLLLSGGFSPLFKNKNSRTRYAASTENPEANRRSSPEQGLTFRVVRNMMAAIQAHLACEPKQAGFSARAIHCPVGAWWFSKEILALIGGRKGANCLVIRLCRTAISRTEPKVMSCDTSPIGTLVR